MSPRADPDGLVTSEAFRDYLTAFRMQFPREKVDKHGLAAGNGRFHSTMTNDDSNSDAQTYDDDAFLGAAHYARPESVDFALPQISLDRSVGRRGFMIGVGAAAATAATAGVASAGGGLTINLASEYAHNPFPVGEVHVAEHQPEFGAYGYIADDDSETTLDVASFDEPDDEDEAFNPIRIRADMVDFNDARAFPRDLTTGEDDDEEDGSALDAEFWTEDGLTVEDDGDALSIAGDAGTATFDEFTIDSGEQRRILQAILNIDQLEADAVVDVEVVDAAGESVFATIDAGADDAADEVIASSQGAGVLYQQQVGDLDGGEALDTIEEIVVDISGGNAELVFHALNLESSSRWDFGTREYIDDDDEVSTRTVYEETGYFGIVSWESLYESDRLSDAVVSDVEYPYTEIEPTSIYVDTEDGGRHDYDTRLRAVYNFDVPSAYDLDIELDEWTDEVAHPSGRYLTMEIAEGLDDTVDMDDVDDVEWTSRTSTYTDASIGDEVELSSTMDSADVFALNEDVLLSGSEADEVAVEESVAGGPTGRQGGGWLDRLFSIPGAIASAITGLGLYSMLSGRGS